MTEKIKNDDFDNVPEKKLYKASKRGQVSGVSVGLADYFGIDVTLVRLAFVGFTLAGGPGIIAYIVLAIVLPDENDL